MFEKLIKFSVSSLVRSLEFIVSRSVIVNVPQVSFRGMMFFPRGRGIFDEISNFKIAVTPRFKVSSKVSRWGSRRRRLRRNKGERSLLVNRICRVVERKEK